ncbi:MAG: hypothetical protein R6V29_11505 [Spirochaetia bacterium]
MDDIALDHMQALRRSLQEYRELTTEASILRMRSKAQALLSVAGL